MSSPSNLYAEKVFAEHPISLWALDEKIDYLSLISESQRDLDSWTISGGQLYSGQDFPNPIFLDSGNYGFFGSPSAQPVNEVSLTSENISNLLSLDQSLETFSVSAYMYSDHVYVLGYEVGFEYTEPLTNEIRRSSRFFIANVPKQWNLISETFKIPVVSADFKVFIKARYSVNPEDVLPEYRFYINGLTVGQWSEEFSATSLGIDQSEVIDITSPVTSKAIKALSYGSDVNFGYYLVDGLKKYATNTSIPMVFGSSSVTKIAANPSGPSLVLPGRGFLNQAGRYQEYTLEFWVRAKTSSNKLRKLVGPLSSEDGIYVNGPFVTLSIGGESASHFVGDWFRPLLIDLKVGIDYANLFVNAEQVLSIDFDTSDMVLPEIEQDWIGFYAYEDLENVELDCIGIYPYQVPSTLIKRRFAFGQAVESPEGTNRAFGGVTAFIDYKFADYTNNYTYPGIGKWTQGIVENLNVSQAAISPPRYANPEVELKNISFQSWIDSLPVADDNVNSYLKFDSESEGYIFLDAFRLSFQSVKAVYGIFEIDSYSNEEKLLIKLENSSTNSSFVIYQKNEFLYYKFKFWGEERPLYFKSGISTNTPFFAGIDVEDLSSFFGDDISSFFGNTNQLKLFVGNDSVFANQFDGKIHKVGICTERNLSKIKTWFDNLEIDAVDLTADPGDVYFGNDKSFWQFFVDGGFVTTFDVAPLLSHIASYTIIAKSNFGRTYLDIETDSYWEDYIPLIHFSQYVDDMFGNKYYDMDFLQFNVGYPSRERFVGNLYDTSEELVKSYISFKHLASGASSSDSHFSSVELMPRSGVITPGDNWRTTKYEVVNGAIIYPPKDVAVEDLAIVTHINIAVSGISTSPISIKKLEYASQAFNDQTANPVKTKFGVALVPYTQTAALFDYKARNPFRIYKGSTPHLYLTSDSGIQRVGRTDELLPRGLATSINSSSASEYRINGIQMFLYYNKDSFSSQAVQLFEVQSTEKVIRVYVKSNDKTGKRATLYAVNANTGSTEDGLAFFINGKIVREPVISLSEWTSIGVAFANPLSFDEQPGAIRITDTVLVNNISYYESSSLQEIQRQSSRSWSRVSSTYGSWINLFLGLGAGTFLWNDVLIVSSISYFGVNPGDIYKSYIGTNKIIVDGVEPLKISNAEVRLFTDVAWNVSVETPV